MEMSKKERIKRSALIILIMVVAIVSIISSRERRARKKAEKEKEKTVEVVGNYNVDIIKVTNVENPNSNYLISPYNIEVALNMLREGANGNTKDELDKVLGNRKINDVSIKDKLNVANGLFIKNTYKDRINTSFVNNLKTNYQAEVLYDEFKEPIVINNWVKEKTNGMIEKILDKMNDNFVLGIASALALDVKWSTPFECVKTKEEEFTKVDNSKMKVEMMHKTYEYAAKYFKNDDGEGIILPYQKEDGSNSEFEFVGLLPKNGVSDYINNLTIDKLSNMTSNIQEASDKLHIILSLPRFTYDYEVSDFKAVLKKMGIIDAFDEVKADFTKIIDNDELYVGEAIHKTKIELNETGTKAAAVTYFGMFAKGMIPHDFERIDVKFDKPFVYMIREKNTGEILFFGTVFEPNVWKGTTCSN